MGFLGFGKKKDDVVDLTEHYKKQQEKLEQQKAAEQKSSDSSSLNVLGGLADSGAQQKTEEYSELGGDIEQRRQKLAKRLMEMTNKLEDLSNQIYHLQQRVELLEKKSGVR